VPRRARKDLDKIQDRRAQVVEHQAAINAAQDDDVVDAELVD
jgi:hypothetical protein